MSYYQDGIELPTGEEVINFLNIREDEVFILLRAKIKKLSDEIGDKAGYGYLYFIEAQINDIKKYIDHLKKIQHQNSDKRYKA